MPRGIADYAALLPFTASSFCDPQHAVEAEAFFRPRERSVPGGERNLAQAVEKVRQCAAYREKQAPSVAAFLQKVVAAK